jgi:hypothetical protein
MILPKVQKVKRFAGFPGVVYSLPGHQFPHHGTISIGEKVLIRWTLTGIPKRDFLGVSASDKPIIVTGFDLEFQQTENLRKCGSMESIC